MYKIIYNKDIEDTIKENNINRVELDSLIL